MTIICAQKTSTGIVLGADNSSSDGSKLIRRVSPKLCRVSPHIAFGTSGHVRLFDALRETVSRGTFPLANATFAKATKTISDVEDELGSFFRAFMKDEFRAAEKGKLWALVVVGDRLFDVGCDGATVEVEGRFSATGSAEHIALGALHTINAIHGILPVTVQAEAWLTMAMEACAEFGECIRPPWSVMSTIVFPE